METKRVLIPDDGFEGVAIGSSLQLILGRMTEGKGIKDCIIMVPSKGHLQNTVLSKVLRMAFRDKGAQALIKAGQLCLQEGKFQIETVRTIKSYSRADAIIVVYADQEMMDKVDSNKNFQIVIAIPCLEESIADWKRTWSPLMVGEKQGSQASLISNPVLEEALETLTFLANLSNSVLTSTDKDATIEVFRILRANNQSEELKNIRAWCIKNGWNSKAADEVVKHAAKAFGLKSKPQNKRLLAPDIYQQWVDASRKSKKEM